MGQAIFEMTAAGEPTSSVSGLIGFSEALAWAQSVESVFSALADFAAGEAPGALLLELHQPSTPVQRWTNAGAARLEMIDGSGVIQLLDDLRPARGRPAAVAWSSQPTPGLHRVGDATTREWLLRAQVGGGILVAMALPSGRSASAHMLVAPGAMHRLGELSRDVFLVAAIQALLAIDRCLGTLPPNELTRREYEALRLSAQGMSARAIAAAMNISEPTVKFHLSGARRKFNVKTTREAVSALINEPPKKYM